ncbi:MAG: hypothetical protein KDA33_03425 [Phycisphaerales bacterium]|nr:hypothetical protein [Phycisphaerales bacterium]
MAHSERRSLDDLNRPARRVMPALARSLVALVLAMTFHAIYAGWHWRVTLHSGKGLSTLSPTSSIWTRESCRTIVASRGQAWIRRITGASPTLAPLWQSDLVHTISTILPTALVAVVTFAWLSRRYGAIESEDPFCRCRKCRHILMGLQAPRCPECGEAI